MALIKQKEGRIINIFLTGEKQIGKTTLIEKALDELKITPGGFKTRRHFINGKQDGFVMESLSQSGKFAENKPFIAKRGEDGYWQRILETFEKYGVELLKKALTEKNDFIVMDELGHFETDALLFQKQVFKCLASPKPVLGVIKHRQTPFLNQIRRRTDLVILTITKENRGEQYKKLTQLIKSIKG